MCASAHILNLLLFRDLCSELQEKRAQINKWDLFWVRAYTSPFERCHIGMMVSLAKTIEEENGVRRIKAYAIMHYALGGGIATSISYF